MKERRSRLKAISAVIKNNRVNSQDMLLQLLHAEGYNITQATLSRDMKYLNVGKMSDGKQGYYYTLPADMMKNASERSYIQDFLRGHISVAFSGNLGVIKTLPGHANSVALAVDNLAFPEVLGTIAGDDTVLVVLKEGITGAVALQKFREKIPELEEA